MRNVQSEKLNITLKSYPRMVSNVPVHTVTDDVSARICIRGTMWR